jgi:hypothetical protein
VVLIISGKFVAERLSSFARAEAKIAGYKFEDIREVETVVIRWLITGGTD